MVPKSCGSPTNGPEAYNQKKWMTCTMARPCNHAVIPFYLTQRFRVFFWIPRLFAPDFVFKQLKILQELSYLMPGSETGILFKLISTSV